MTGDDPLGRVQAALAQRFPSEDRMVPDVERITLLCELMGDPQRAYPSIHLTGTNGKTSTARMVDSLLRAAGVRAGRYTSPHLQSIVERIAIDGQPISDERFGEVYDEVAPYVELVDARLGLPMTFFEVLTGMAFAAFADAPVDAAVVEVGLGGRWDATNVLDARTCVVTPVSLDHTQLLGSTVAEIAEEKAGIVSEGALVVLGQQVPEAAEVLLRRCVEVGATVAREGLEFGVASSRTAVGGQLLTLQGLGATYEDVFLPLFGRHQASNAACALAAAESLLGEGLDADVVREGFATTSSPGRLEVVRTSPTVLLDAAHNPHGAAALVAALGEGFSFTTLVGVVAVLGDKDARGMLEVLEPALTSIVVTETGSPRRMPVEDLREMAEDVFGSERVAVEDRLDDALDAATAMADAAGEYGAAGVLVTGSVVTVGEARALLARR